MISPPVRIQFSYSFDIPCKFNKFSSLTKLLTYDSAPELIMQASDIYTPLTIECKTPTLKLI